jgi:hypothetical protein
LASRRQLLAIASDAREAEPRSEDQCVVEEAMYAIDGAEIVLADLDGRTFATSPLELDDDPAVVARSLLHAKVGKRPKPLIFPDVGYA